MSKKTDMQQNLSILSSLLYLRGEVKKAGYERTESLLDYASHTFFEDLKEQTLLDGDLAQIKEILDYVEQMNPGSLKKALTMIASFEPENDNSSQKRKNKSK